MKQKVLVLFATNFDFTNNDGKRVSGTKIEYLMTSNLEPPVNKEKNTKGYRTAAATMDLDVYSQLVEVPGVYDLDIELRAGKDGKVTAVPVGISFVGSVFDIDVLQD